MKRIGVLLSALMVVGIALSWWFAPAQAVKRKTVSFAEAMTFHGNRGARVMDVYTLNGLLADPLLIEAPFMDLEKHEASRSEIESAYTWLRDRAKTSRFEVRSFDSVNVSDDAAVVQVVLDGQLELPQIRVMEGQHRVTFRWVRMESVWRLAGIRWLESGPRHH